MVQLDAFSCRLEDTVMQHGLFGLKDYLVKPVCEDCACLILDRLI